MKSGLQRKRKKLKQAGSQDNGSSLFGQLLLVELCYSDEV
jgi:hypothetical protein